MSQPPDRPARMKSARQREPIRVGGYGPGGCTCTITVVDECPVHGAPAQPETSAPPAPEWNERLTKALMHAWVMHHSTKPGERGAPNNVYFSVRRAVEVLAPVVQQHIQTLRARPVSLSLSLRDDPLAVTDLLADNQRERERLHAILLDIMRVLGPIGAELPMEQWAQHIEGLTRQLARECVWTTDEDSSMWETGCKHAFQFIEDGPKENGAKFCCYCGGTLVPLSAPPAAPTGPQEDQ